ncbi:MAG: nucleotidyltransferase domain-containing protein, partial [Chloroflexota bacterium]|nr:nucleotidyltransferase domain-containing protein [Chloroflexota bacterium]
MKTKPKHSARERARPYVTAIPINGTRIKPKNAIHRKKLLALQAYVRNLLASPARPDIAKIILFGSVAKGEAHPESDVDVMVLGFDRLDLLRDASYDATLELGEYAGEGIEPLF